MKKFGWTYLFIAVVVALIAFTLFDIRRARQTAAEHEANSQILRVEMSEISAFEYSAKGDIRRFEKKDGEWRVVQPFQDSADQQAILTYLESLYAEKVQEVVTESAPDLKAYGLDAPLFQLTIVSPLKTQTLKVGAIKAYDGSLYAQVDSEPRVILISSAWDVFLSKPARELRDKRVYRRDMAAKIKSVTLRGKALESVSRGLLFSRNEKGDWKGEGAGEHPLASQSVDAFIEQVKALRAFDYTTIAATNTSALQALGFNRPEYEITFTYEADEKPFVLRFADFSQNDGPNIEATSSDLQLAVAVYREAAKKVMPSAKDFYDRKAPFAFQVNDVSKIIIRLPGKGGPAEKVFEKKGDLWEKPQADLLEKLSRLEALRFLSSEDLARMSAQSKIQMPSQIQLLKADGGRIFDLSWGQTVTEKAVGEMPEAVILPVRTQGSKDPVALAEGVIANLGLESL